MFTVVNLYSMKEYEIANFLKKFFNTENIEMNNPLKWEKKYSNSIEIADIIGTFIDNNDEYDINMWVSLDDNAFINVTEYNADKIIRYIYERFPY